MKFKKNQKTPVNKKIIEVFKMEALVYSQDRNFMATYGRKCININLNCYFLMACHQERVVQC